LQVWDLTELNLLSAGQIFVLFRISVTRWGEFSPNGRLLTMGTFSKITEVAQIFELLFSKSINYLLILTKFGLGYILSDFFTNLSGHTVKDSKWIRKPGRVIFATALAKNQEWVSKW
jgi:hypothetical protein